jgi:hypothetical protein
LATLGTGGIALSGSSTMRVRFAPHRSLTILVTGILQPAVARKPRISRLRHNQSWVLSRPAADGAPRHAARLTAPRFVEHLLDYVIERAEPGPDRP